MAVIIKEYILVQHFPNGGSIKRHRLVKCQCKNYLAALEVAYDKAIKGAKVFILPELNQNDPMRETVFNGAKKNKCPDLLVDGDFVEVKTPDPGFDERNIKTNIKYAYRQANKVVIRLVEEFDKKRLKTIAKGRFLDHRELEQIEFKMGGNYYKYERRVLLKK
jgi:hypothetical protein